MKKDKQKVTNEVITDELMDQFFELESPADVTVDYHILERAYRGLNAPDFERFIDRFVSQGMDLNTQGPDGTLLEVISTHRLGEDYAAAIRKHL